MIVFKRIQYKDNNIYKLMLYRAVDVKLIEIKKHNFINDKLYYEKVLDIKTPIIPKLEKTFKYKYNK